MTWTRLSDTWCEDEALEALNLAARWHYLCMIQFCSRNKKYDGVLRLVDARRCSDLDDPVDALGALILGGLVKNLDGATVKVVRIDEHIPPPSVRTASEATRVRVARHRRHKNGDHSECLEGRCGEVGNAGSNELPQDRSGQAGTGNYPPTSELEDDDEPPWRDDDPDYTT